MLTESNNSLETTPVEPLGSKPTPSFRRVSPLRWTRFRSWVAQALGVREAGREVPQTASTLSLSSSGGRVVRLSRVGGFALGVRSPQT
jgi:hypothetical protein